MIDFELIIPKGDILTNGQNTYSKRLYNFEITCGTIHVEK